jgi:hypothetical protein
MELNKLKLASKKCAKIHIGKKIGECPEYRIHEQKLQESKSEKYLGDYISEKGTLDDTIQQRTLKGYAYISEIRALLSDMPFGHRRVQVGLMLRDAMFVNGILLNSEAWHGITKKHIEKLEVMDRSLLKYIVKAHSKVQNEFIYLEMGILKIEQIISCRRMLYLQTILKREDKEITKRVYHAQKKSPSEGDWLKLVEGDFKTLGLEINETLIQNCTKSQFKVMVKTSLKSHIFSELKKEQAGHSKIKTIKYPIFQSQEYLKTHMMNNHEVSLLFALRSKTVKQFKANFPFHSDSKCPMCGKEEDTQDHCIKCEVTYPQGTRDLSIVYSDLFSEDIVKQTAITKLFAALLQRREDASASTAGPSSCPGYPGQCYNPPFCAFCTSL